MIPGPLPPARRIAAIDVLRGLALLGIVVVNSAYFGLPLTESLASKQGEGPMLDQIAGMLVSVFAEFKFISIFSILFGFGLAMQRARRLESTGRFAGFGYRRMAALALFGLVHACGFWFGDVLFIYALVGSVAILLLPLPSHVRLILSLCGVGLAVVLTLGFGVLQMWGSQFADPTATADPGIRGWDAINAAMFDPAHPAWLVGETAAYAEGPLADAMLFRSASFGFALFATVLTFGWQILGLALFGSWMHDRDFFGETSAPLRRRLTIIALPIGLVMSLIDGGLWWNFGLMSVPGAIASSIHGLAAFLMAIGIISAVTELVHRTWMPAAGVLAAVGRMSLSAYLLETLLFTAIMQWWGLGWFGSVGRAGLVGLAFANYAIVATLCVMWGRTFGMGPMERLWRLLSYGSARRS